VERLAGGKHYGLLQKNVNYGSEGFYRIGPGLFLSSVGDEEKKVV
jgi:hypothetical protein